MTKVRDDNFDNKEPSFTIHPVSPPTRDAVTCMVLLDRREREDASVATLLTNSADGFTRGWSTCLAGGGLKSLFHAGHSIGSYVLHCCADDHNELLFTADSLGYVKVWFICEWANKLKPPDHRHEFDPRHFPALRRYKPFGPALAGHAARMQAAKTGRESYWAVGVTHLDLRNHNRPDFRCDKFLFLGCHSPAWVHVPRRGSIYQSGTRKHATHYNIEKVQADWIRRLPKWQRAELILLQKEGNLHAKSFQLLVHAII
ncbi:hypothetical protein RvY_07503 [Ramazzottius varieornatus]|uniref:Uncharacterized protein n=1 Tax=Ramazzottius varieornatus TaxID=947166 RepID=A0A1D1V7F9_RAMVA|nr:hypothetical protein RvY_07503 [Ramazzottius varieornatus]